MDLFRFKVSSVLDELSVLSNDEERQTVELVKKPKKLENYHILGIDFLLQKYHDKSPGAILNEEYGLNSQLQVSVFLNLVLDKLKFLVLVLCPDNSLPAWHYHLMNHGGLKVLKIDAERNVQENCTVHLVSFSGIRLVEDLIECDYSVAIIDHFDQVASKRVIRSINSGFNLGLTNRNFYENPDQKLQWTMLNWCDKGCAGKLSDFYKRDNENLLNFRDNYRHWWFRLTWDFCDTFQKPTEADTQVYNEEISHWAESQKLNNIHSNQTNKRKHAPRRKKDEKKSKRTKPKLDETKTEKTKSELVELDPNQLKVTKSEPVEIDERNITKVTNPDSQENILESNKEEINPCFSSESVNIDLPKPTVEVPNKNYTLSPKTRDHELFLSLLNPNARPEKRENIVSSEVEEILKEADELLS